MQAAQIVSTGLLNVRRSHLSAGCLFDGAVLLQCGQAVQQLQQ